MTRHKYIKTAAGLLSLALLGSVFFTACGTSSASSASVSVEADTAGSSDAATEADTADSSAASGTQEEEIASESSAETENETESAADSADSLSAEAVSGDSSETITTTFTGSTTGALDTTDLFTERDLEQTADLSEAVYYTVTDGEDITITEEGVYVISGEASDVTIYVETDDTAKVQIVLDGVTITNADMPCIYVKEADKVFVTTSSDSSLTTSGTFAEDADNNVDAVIYATSDLVLNGTAVLTVSSSDTAVKSKDDLKINGGTYDIAATTTGFEANDSIVIAAGTFTVTAGTDAFHAENEDDDSLGYIFIADGTFTITAGDDGIHAVSVLQIDGGTFEISAAEGLEATYVQINGGTIYIAASDDGINAANKSSAYQVVLEITGGDITIEMGSGDTDGLDSNGDVMISGGTVDITGSSGVDFDGTGTLSGGTLIVNGVEQTELVADMMGMGGGQMGGQMNGQMNGGQMGGQMGSGIFS